MQPPRRQNEVGSSSDFGTEQSYREFVSATENTGNFTGNSKRHIAKSLIKPLLTRNMRGTEAHQTQSPAGDPRGAFSFGTLARFAM